MLRLKFLLVCFMECLNLFSGLVDRIVALKFDEAFMFLSVNLSKYCNPQINRQPEIFGSL